MVDLTKDGTSPTSPGSQRRWSRWLLESLCWDGCGWCLCITSLWQGGLRKFRQLKTVKNDTEIEMSTAFAQGMGKGAYKAWDRSDKHRTNGQTVEAMVQWTDVLEALSTGCSPVPTDGIN